MDDRTSSLPLTIKSAPVRFATFLAQLPCKVGALATAYRVNHPQKWETVKIHVSGIDRANSMLPHQRGDVQITEDIPGDVWHLSNDLSGYGRMAVSLGEDCDTRGC
jgi:hypothetical protein